jgi:hypothetical protein
MKTLFDVLMGWKSMFHTFYHEQERRKRVQGWQRIRHDPFFSGKWKQHLQVDGQSQAE